MVKVQRSYPAPASLEIESKKKSGSYNKKDVCEQLRKDFHDKCYICELKGLQDPEVEHLLPHKNGKYPERKFNWDNLFWCCGHCNGVKNKGKYDEGIIDCCKQDPEKQLEARLIDGEVLVEAIDINDKQAVLTASLLNETFNLKNHGIRDAACSHRMNQLMKTMDILYKELEHFKNNPNSARNKRMLRVLLSREAAFAAFTRYYVRSNLDCFPELEEYVQGSYSDC